MSSLFSRGKKSSHKHSSSSSTPTSSFLSRLPAFSSSSPTVYYSAHTPVARVHRSTEYIYNNKPPPYDGSSSITSPAPTPSTSWTSEMSALADRIKDNHASADGADSLDRKSIAQGMKLVAVAADEFEDGNRTIALEIYLSGIDKIVMALPNKADPMTKQALRDKLTSVEERVGFLNIAGQHRRKETIEYEDPNDANMKRSSILDSFGLSSLMSVIVNAASACSSGGGHHEKAASTSTLMQYKFLSSSPATCGSSEGIDKFKRVGQVVINAAVALAIFIKQSPLPDIAYFMFNFMVQLFVWIDGQYHVVTKGQDLGIECVKLLLKMDEQYRLHELVSETMYMFVAAGIKAAVAYKEAPAFRHDRDREVADPSKFYEEDHREECQPKPSSRWIW